MTIAGLASRIVDVELPGLMVRLHTVRQLADHVDPVALLRDADAPEPPYWAHLWPGSRALARLLLTGIDCHGKRIVEVGCGLGLVGIVAALRGASVTMIDNDATAVAFATASAALNQCSVQVLQSDLHTTVLPGCFDYVCAADITYDPTLQVALADFAARSLCAGGRLLCTESVRTFDRGLRDACGAHGLQIDEHELREIDEGRPVSVRLHTACGRTTNAAIG